MGDRTNEERKIKKLNLPLEGEEPGQELRELVGERGEGEGAGEENH